MSVICEYCALLVWLTTNIANRNNQQDVSLVINKHGNNYSLITISWPRIVIRTIIKLVIPDCSTGIVLDMINSINVLNN